MNEPKIYLPTKTAKQVSDKLLKLSFKADELIAFVQQHKNERGFINFGVTPRREPDKYQNTHCMWLDTWQPNRQRTDNPDFASMRNAANQADDPANNWPKGKQASSQPELPADDKSDVPF